MIEFKQPTILYVYVPDNPDCCGLTDRFLESYQKFRPGVQHSSLIVCNGGVPKDGSLDKFACLPDLHFTEHDNSGWDIGAYIAASKIVTAPWVVYFGTPAYLQRDNWMLRMEAAWKKHGPGLYGSMASYEESPHLCTSGFWCQPELVAAYPHPVEDKPARYNFEHSPIAFWRMVQAQGLPVKLVTWDGEWDWDQWRIPRNGYASGDQSNCLTGMRHSFNFSQWPAHIKKEIENRADRLVHPDFLRMPRRGMGGNIHMRDKIKYH